MGMRCYLAMTAAEFGAAEVLPQHPAWMACHFSCYGTGLSNLPQRLPQDAMVIVNDRTPVQGHDPALILEQLIHLAEMFTPSCFLLDLQRPGVEETAAIARLLTQKLPCPVGVTEYYAGELDCPVFLAPPPLHVTLQEYLSPWKGRDIWLEAAAEAEEITVTEKGSSFAPATMEALAEPVFEDTDLHCRYHTELARDSIIFRLQRGKRELSTLLDQAQALGVTQTVGLYQQLGSDITA